LLIIYKNSDEIESNDNLSRTTRKRTQVVTATSSVEVAIINKKRTSSSSSSSSSSINNNNNNNNNDYHIENKQFNRINKMKKNRNSNSKQLKGVLLSNDNDDIMKDDEIHIDNNISHDNINNTDNDNDKSINRKIILTGDDLLQF